MRGTSLIFTGAIAGVGLALIATHPPYFWADGLQRPPLQRTSSSTSLATCTSGCRRLRREAGRSELVESAINGMLAGVEPHWSSIGTLKCACPTSADPANSAGSASRSPRRMGWSGWSRRLTAPLPPKPAQVERSYRRDDEQVQGLALNHAVDKMRGPANTKIKLTIMRKARKSRSSDDRTRDRVLVRSHTERDDVGYIGYRNLTRDHRRPEKGVSELKREIGPGKIKGYVIELRNNPGGLLDQAIRSRTCSWTGAKWFPPAAVMPRTPNAITPRAATSPTASRSRVDQCRHGLGLGNRLRCAAGSQAPRSSARVFGKGSVQTIFPLGADGARRLTTARYFTPSGRSIQWKRH